MCMGVVSENLHDTHREIEKPKPWSNGRAIMTIWAFFLLIWDTGADINGIMPVVKSF